MKTRLLFAWLCCFCVLLSGCKRTPEDAKNDLKKLNYAFTTEDFVRAAATPDEKAIKLFLEAGIDVNAKTSDGWTAFLKAVYLGKKAAVELLADQSSEDLNRALLLASLQGNPDIARVLLEHGAEVDTKSDDGTTALIVAARAGNIPLVKLLLEAGADKSLTDNHGATAADQAFAKGFNEAASLVSDASVAAATSSPGTHSTPGSSPISPDSVAQQIVKGNSSDSFTGQAVPEEAWWRKYGLNPNMPGVISQDADGDRFTNGEEFLSDTSPIDPASYPAYATKLKWIAFHSEKAPLTLVSVNDSGATLRNAAGVTITVSKGADAGESWKVASIRKAEGQDKDGQPYDASVVNLENAEGRKLRLVPGVDAQSATSYATVALPFSDEEFQLHRGQNFVLPGDKGRRYSVLDLRETQVIIKETNSGETFTVGKANE
ncbi:MAG TPA: Amuc_1099 family pilus-like system protein [Chthoniobacterales bacterium]